MAKVLLINGSGNEHGCTFTALSEAAKALNEEGVETEIIQLGKDAIRDCIGCGSCGKLGRCVFDDDRVNLVAAKAKEADGFILRKPGLLCASERTCTVLPGPPVLFGRQCFCLQAGGGSAFGKTRRNYGIL